MHGSHQSRAHLARRLSFAGAAASLMAFVLTLATGSVSEAAPAGTLSMSPSSASVNVGDTVAVTLDVSGGSDIHAADLTVQYNPVIVQVVDADSGVTGTQISPGAFPGTTSVGLAHTNSAGGGVIQYAYAFNSAGVEANGGGTVATVQFLALAPGNANLQWSAAWLEDGEGETYAPTGTAATLMVGQPATTPTPSVTPTATPSSTPSVTGTETPDVTPSETPSATPTPGASSTPGPATATGTAAAAATPGFTVVAGPPPQSRNGVDPAQTDRAQGLPSAGNEGPGVEWWRWVFFLAALMLGAAGWFFTFAVHYGDREPILVDRHDRRRRRR